MLSCGTVYYAVQGCPTALVNGAARLAVEGERCLEVGLALGCVGPVPFRAGKAEALLLGKRLDEDLIRRAAETAAQESAPLGDGRAGAAYRKEMVAVFVAESLKRSRQRSGG